MKLYEKLNAIDVNAYTELKGKLTYLKWSAAFRILEQNAEAISYKIIETNDGLVYWDSPLGLLVKTEMTVDGITKGMILPVMDNNNAPMYSTPGKVIRWNKEVERPVATIFDINTAIMRCYVKNIAMFGLGNYIYEGHTEPEAENITDAKVLNLEELERLKKEKDAEDEVVRKKKLWTDFCADLKEEKISREQFLEFHKINLTDKAKTMNFIESYMGSKQLRKGFISKFNKSKEEISE